MEHETVRLPGRQAVGRVPNPGPPASVSKSDPRSKLPATIVATQGTCNVNARCPASELPPRNHLAEAKVVARTQRVAEVVAARRETASDEVLGYSPSRNSAHRREAIGSNASSPHESLIAVITCTRKCRRM